MMSEAERREKRAKLALQMYGWLYATCIGMGLTVIGGSWWWLMPDASIPTARYVVGVAVGAPVFIVGLVGLYKSIRKLEAAP